MKDTLVVASGKSSGAEVIPYIKVWMMFPTSVFLTYLFTRLLNRHKRETVFYVMMGIFLGYYALFVCFLYPMREVIHPHAFADRLQEILPLGAKGFVTMIRYWTFTTFYVMSELWGNIVLFLLFWGFANQISEIGEAKRFYAILGIGTNVSGIFAGEIAVQFSAIPYTTLIPYGYRAWDQQILYLLVVVLFCGLSSIALYRWMHTKVLDKVTHDTVASHEGEVKGRMSMKDNFSYVFRSRYMISIALICVAYNIIINLVEVMWKDQVHVLYPDPSDYNLYMNQVMVMIGVIATIASIGFTGNLVRWFGWTFTALLTPAILLVTSVLFFGSFFMQGELSMYSLIAGVNPLSVIVFFGTLQNCLSRAAKYTFFDTTKEMAFVPLPNESKLKGKALIDGVFVRMGKAGGSLVHQTLLLTFASISASAPYVAAVLGGTIVMWIAAVKALGRDFTALSAKEKDTPILIREEQTQLT